MSLSLGFYDVFSYAVPGSLYLALGAYIAGRLQWLDVARFTHAPTVLLIGGIIVASYLLGFVTYPLASAAERLLRHRKSSDDARAEFLERCPSAQGRPYVRADLRLLQAAAEVLIPHASQEILRLRAVGIMTRNCAIPLLLTSITAAVTAINGTRPLLTLIVAGLGAAATAAAVWQARRFSHWANMKILETCYWIPEVDDRLTTTSPSLAKRNAGRPRRATAQPQATSAKGSP